jgi:hypothetical protein
LRHLDPFRARSVARQCATGCLRSRAGRLGLRAVPRTDRIRTSCNGIARMASNSDDCPQRQRKSQDPSTFGQPVAAELRAEPPCSPTCRKGRAVALPRYDEAFQEARYHDGDEGFRRFATPPSSPLHSFTNTLTGHAFGSIRTPRTGRRCIARPPSSISRSKSLCRCRLDDACFSTDAG